MVVGVLLVGASVGMAYAAIGVVGVVGMWIEGEYGIVEEAETFSVELGVEGAFLLECWGMERGAMSGWMPLAFSSEGSSPVMCDSHSCSRHIHEDINCCLNF